MRVVDEEGIGAEALVTYSVNRYMRRRSENGAVHALDSRQLEAERRSAPGSIAWRHCCRD